jgi:hypothetical protein
MQKLARYLLEPWTAAGVARLSSLDTLHPLCALSSVSIPGYSRGTVCAFLHIKQLQHSHVAVDIERALWQALHGHSSIFAG